MNFRKTLSILSRFFLLALLFFMATPVFSCTIFVLTDARRTLFFNNEDWSNPSTRMWFMPAGKGYYGCSYLGFDDGWAQGGLNTQGLAFDWVAGFNEKWVPGPGLARTQGNPSERMLETCATVEEAIAFYRKYREPSFSYAKILIADKTGASVIIGAKNGQLSIDRSNQSRGFGYGAQMLTSMLALSPAPTVDNGIPILQACLKQGAYTTKYSNVFDLKSGDIFLLSLPNQKERVKLNLAAELEKGAHYYEIPNISRQLTQTPVSLPSNMKRFLLDGYQPIPDLEPTVTKRYKTILQQAITGALHPEDFTAEFWQAIAPVQKEAQAELEKLGGFISLTLVERKKEPRQCRYLYCLEFENATVLQRFVLDEGNKVALIKSEGAEPKFDARKANE